VIAYDRLILNTPNVDSYVAYDNFKVGELQGQALLDGLKAKKPNGPYNIELFSGSSDDANSKVFFGGALKVLKPKITEGTLVVGSGQTDIKQTATAAWKSENAQTRMDALLTSTYGTKSIDGVLSPNDTLAGAIITSVKSAGKPIPVVTGQDSEGESVKSIMVGEQYSHDQQGHPPAGVPGHLDGQGPAGRQEGPAQRHHVLQQRREDHPRVPASPGHRHQGECRRSVRERPGPLAADQVAGSPGGRQPGDQRLIVSC